MAAATPLQVFKSRVQRGARMTLVTYEINGQPRAHRYLDVPREVVDITSRQFVLAPVGSVNVQRSYCDWPKATQLTLVGDLAQIDEGGCLLVYRFD